MHQQLRLVDPQQLQQPELRAQVALLHQLGHAQLFLAVDRGPALRQPLGGFLGVGARAMGLFVQFASQVGIVTRKPVDLDIAALG